jgi:hypothetical protein
MHERYHRTMIRLILVSILAVGSAAALAADTLVLRNGTRIEGELLAVRNGMIEFEERRGFGRARRIEIDRDEVVRIEFDTLRPGAGNDFGTGSRPGGMRERQVVVSADAPWNDAGIDVRAGQTLYFQATGTVRWGRDRRDDPGGEDNSPVNPNRPMPNRPAAALIGKVGATSTDYFFIGDETGAVRMRSSGRLYLGVNDDFLADNSGNFRVTVYY